MKVLKDRLRQMFFIKKQKKQNTSLILRSRCFVFGIVTSPGGFPSSARCCMIQVRCVHNTTVIVSCLEILVGWQKKLMSWLLTGNDDFQGKKIAYKLASLILLIQICLLLPTVSTLARLWSKWRLKALLIFLRVLIKFAELKFIVVQ